jgi:hypothetical protein
MICQWPKAFNYPFLSAGRNERRFPLRAPYGMDGTTPTAKKKKRKKRREKLESSPNTRPPGKGQERAIQAQRRHELKERREKGVSLT